MNSKPLAPVWALSLAIVVGSLRLLTNVMSAFNAAPVSASATFGGARLRLWQALLLPLGIMVVTDFILFAVWGERYAPWDMTRVWVYPCLLANVLLGSLIIRSRKGWQIPQIGIATLSGSIVFFLVTNFGAWLDPRFEYPETMAGLVDCYILGLPFWRSSLISDTLFTFGLFGIEALIISYVQRASVPVETPQGAQG